MKNESTLMKRSLLEMSGSLCGKLEGLQGKFSRTSLLIITSLLCFSLNIAMAGNGKKVVTSHSAENRGLSGPSTLYKLYTNMYVVNTDGSLSLADGIASTYYYTYNNAVDAQDAPKLNSFNTRESICIMRDGVELAVEKRQPITGFDTTYLQISEMNTKTYQLQFVAQNFNPAVIAYLTDEYTGATTPINLSMTDTTKYTFDVQLARPASNTPNRFSIVYRPSALLPVIFSSVSAGVQNNAVKIGWTVENETDVLQYNIERSTDGQHFGKVYTQMVTDNAAFRRAYTWTDASIAGSSVYYYRISNKNENGSGAYSRIIKVQMDNTVRSGINVYPTVVQDGVVGLQFTNMKQGKYTFRMINTLGQVLLTRSLNHQGGNATQTFNIDRNGYTGLMQLTINGPDNYFQTVKLINR